MCMIKSDKSVTIKNHKITSELRWQFRKQAHFHYTHDYPYYIEVYG